MISVSIIIPIYNVEPYIGDCLQSVVSQTYKGPIECILVDDCGTDKSIEIAKHYINNYKGNITFRLFHHENNKGLSASRNTGIRNAVGEYLFFIDSDDYITPDCINYLVELCHEKEDIICGAYQTIGGHLNYWSDIYHLINFSSFDQHEILKFYTQGSLYPMAYNKLIRKDLIYEHQLFFKDGIIHEDELWSFLVANHAKSLKTTPHITYKYRIREGSIIQSSSNKKSHENHIIIISEMDKLLKNGIIHPYKENYDFVWRKKLEWWNYIIEERHLSFFEKNYLLFKFLKENKKTIFLKSWIKESFHSLINIASRTHNT